MSVDTENGWAYSTLRATTTRIRRTMPSSTTPLMTATRAPTSQWISTSAYGLERHLQYLRRTKLQSLSEGREDPVLRAGTAHSSNGTEQMENPDIQISTDGGIAVKSAVLTDIPAGQKGSLPCICRTSVPPHRASTLPIICRLRKAPTSMDWDTDGRCACQWTRHIHPRRRDGEEGNHRSTD